MGGAGRGAHGHSQRGSCLILPEGAAQVRARRPMQVASHPQDLLMCGTTRRTGMPRLHHRHRHRHRCRCRYGLSASIERHSGRVADARCVPAPPETEDGQAHSDLQAGPDAPQGWAVLPPRRTERNLIGRPSIGRPGPRGPGGGHGGQAVRMSYTRPFCNDLGCPRGGWDWGFKEAGTGGLPPSPYCTFNPHCPCKPHRSSYPCYPNHPYMEHSKAQIKEPCCRFGHRTRHGSTR